MAGAFQSIFNRTPADAPEPPSADKPLMRVLEPRVLLDAAAAETALDIAGQAAHSQLADDFMEDCECDPAEDGDGGDVAKNLEANARRTDREIVFIDAGIEDHEGLIASLEPGVSIHMIESGADGVQQIADILSASGADSFDAVHIFSHVGNGPAPLLCHCG